MKHNRKKTKSNTFKDNKKYRGSNFIQNQITNNNTNNNYSRLKISRNEQIIRKKLNFAEEGTLKDDISPIINKTLNKNLDKIKDKLMQDSKTRINKESKKDIRPDSKFKNKNINISDSFPNNNSFIQSDIEEIKSIFDIKDLKKNGINTHYLETSNLFDNSEEKEKEKEKEKEEQKEEISIKDLDPKIKDVLILFVLSSDYYELLVEERAKNAFNFSKKNKK